jgi:dethiobiotin synthetase
MGQLIFVTGTGTNVGKTVFTALLLAHLRGRRLRALAIKPFSSGSREDAQMFQAIQGDELSMEEANPFYFPAPVAPAAMPELSENISLESVIQRIRCAQSRCDLLLIEGIGGLCVPINRQFMVADILRELNCPTVIMARNELGALNHSALTVKVLQSFGLQNLTLVFMATKKRDIASRTNLGVLQFLLPGVPQFAFPFLPRWRAERASVMALEKKLREPLAKIFDSIIFSPVQQQSGASRQTKRKSC